MSRTRSSRRRSPASRRKTALDRELTTKRRGELAELAFVLKAASLGFGVARPYGDSERYDVIIDARELVPPKASRGRQGHRDQQDSCGDSRLGCPAARKHRAAADAKRELSTTAARPRHPRAPRAAVPFAPSPPLWRVQVKCSTQLCNGLYRINAHRRANGRAVPYLPGEIDFFAAYIIPEDTWYLIPLHAARGVTSLLFRRRDDPKPGLYDAYREAWSLLRPKP